MDITWMSVKMRAHHRDFMWVLPGQSLSPIKSLSSIRKRGFVVDLFFFGPFWAPYILGGVVNIRSSGALDFHT